MTSISRSSPYSSSLSLQASVTPSVKQEQLAAGTDLDSQVRIVVAGKEPQDWPDD
jgi:hypothetical protein